MMSISGASKEKKQDEENDMKKEDISQTSAGDRYGGIGQKW